MGLRTLGACDCGLCRAARLAFARRFSQRVAVDVRLGEIYRRGLVRECGHSRAPVRELVYGRGLQPGDGSSCVAVCGVGAVLLYGRDGGGRARAGRGMFLRQSGAELPAAADERTALPPRGRRPVRGDPPVGGAARRDAAGYQPLPLLLQPVGYSGALADRADAGGVELGCTPARIPAAGAGFGLDRPAVCADGADQNHGCFSGAGGGVGDGAAAREQAESGGAMRRGERMRCRGHLWFVDGADCRFWSARRLQILLFCEHLPQASGVLLAAGGILVVVSRDALGRSQPGAAGGSDGAGRGHRVADGVGPKPLARPDLWRVALGRCRLCALYDPAGPPPAALLRRAGVLLLLCGGAGRGGAAR